MRYEITNDNVVLIFNDGDTVPFLSQPDYPNRDPWTKEEAEALVIAGGGGGGRY